jgi:hypothetical protein
MGRRPERPPVRLRPCEYAGDGATSDARGRLVRAGQVGVFVATDRRMGRTLHPATWSGPTMLGRGLEVDPWTAQELERARPERAPDPPSPTQSEPERVPTDPDHPQERVVAVLRTARARDLAIQRRGLAEQTGLDDAALDDALAELIGAGVVRYSSGWYRLS